MSFRYFVFLGLFSSLALFSLCLEGNNQNKVIITSTTLTEVSSTTLEVTPSTSTTSATTTTEILPTLPKEENKKVRLCSKHFDCELGEKCFTVYAGEIGGVKFPHSECFKKEFSCKSDADCELGLKCFPWCYNKKYEKWYNEEAVSCNWNSSSPSYKNVKCKCINNLCEIKTPPRCKSNEDCTLGLRCYPGGYCQ